jgi:TatD DNase family protein
MILADSHCHLDRYQPQLLPELLKRARQKGVSIFVSVGKTLQSSEGVLGLAQSHEGVHGLIGIHPWDAVPLTDEVRKKLYELARREQVAAIGEIGLDYVQKPETKELQKELFAYQLSLARESGLSVNVHCKEAHQDMMHIVRKQKGQDLRGLVHGFSGSSAELRDWLDLGFYVSIGFRGFIVNEKPSLETVVREVPSDRLLIETDSTATGQPTGPVDVISVAEKLAYLRGTTAEEIASSTTENLKRLLKL